MEATTDAATKAATRAATKSGSAHRRRIDILAACYGHQADSGLPKHMRVRNAILEAIRDGSLKAGDQIPPEQDLSAAVNVSLGTVQRALGRLATDGALVREHGRGTFVAEPRRPVDELWQMRFLAEDGESLLPVYSRVVDQRVVAAPGPWSRALGPDPQGYLRIARIFNIGDRFTCYSWFLVAQGRFGDLGRHTANARESVNLRRLLGEELGAPTVSVTQRVRVVVLPDAVCDALSLDRNTMGMAVDAVGHGYGGSAISFHRIWVPPTDYTLDMTQDPAAGDGDAA